MLEKEFLDISLRDWAWILGGIVTFIGLIKGLFEFIKSNRIRRVGFIEKLILEFNEAKMYLAKKILDDFWIELNGNSQMTDEELVKIGSKEKIDSEKLKAEFNHLMRHHETESVTGYGEQKARQSFDDLLDFFTLLEYYLSLNLISKKELYYFEYYLKRCNYKADGAVLNYAIAYGYISMFRLLYVLGIDPKDKDFFITNSKFFEKNRRFTGIRQRFYYWSLRYNFLPVF